MAVLPTKTTKPGEIALNTHFTSFGIGNLFVQIIGTSTGAKFAVADDSVSDLRRITDLILTIDAFEDQLLVAIDGKRSLAEILQFAVQDDDDERRALNFFERLWQYDQVVFDASRAAANHRDRGKERQ
jgi:hypothetical protein